MFRITNELDALVTERDIAIHNDSIYKFGVANNIPMDKICLVCHQSYRLHFGITCPIVQPTTPEVRTT
jgi:hypothetical protein